MLAPFPKVVKGDGTNRTFSEQVSKGRKVLLIDARRFWRYQPDARVEKIIYRFRDSHFDSPTSFVVQHASWQRREKTKKSHTREHSVWTEERAMWLGTKGGAFHESPVNSTTACRLEYCDRSEMCALRPSRSNPL